MCEYFFHLNQRDEITTQVGGSTHDQAAQLEAVHFLGELLCDMAAPDASTVSVTVVKCGRVIFTIRAEMSGPTH